jgi:hypothetical protein
MAGCEAGEMRANGQKPGFSEDFCLQLAVVFINLWEFA